MELNERILELAIMNELERDKIPVTVTLTNGTELQGVVVRNDLLVVVLDTDGVQRILYKHSIAYLTPLTPVKCASHRK